jgi:hypothetical protein
VAPRNEINVTKVTVLIGLMLREGVDGRSRAVGDRTGLGRTQVVDEEGAAVLDDDRQGEEAAVVKGVGVLGPHLQHFIFFVN